MNTSVEGIIVNNCQYAPIYLIQDPGATQANTYVLTPSCIEQPKPISNNLKTFYENSGNIENGLVNVDAAARASVPKQKECVLIGNNLKLASFLLPKTEYVNKPYVVDNIVLKPEIKPAISHPPTPVPVNVNTVPKIDMARKIVKLKEVPILNRNRPDKYVPKIKPKETIPSPNPSKHTSVQLIKLGETYHSLNHLSEDQMKMVNQALKMFKDPDKTSSEPTTYDPVTNTRYIYKLVSPKDLTVVGPKKFVVKEKKLTKIPKRVVEEKIKMMKQMRPVKEEPPELDSEPEPEPPLKTKVTRSGRKVKLPKQIVPEDSLHKSKKKCGTVISCFQCSVEFSSLYRLQKHYENHPTHIPAKIHTNLFHCLLAIVKSGSEGDKTNIFIQQLEHLIVKLKSLLPCLLKKVQGSDGQSCTINDDVGRLFGMNPGKYNIDVGALNCLKDKNGYCIHNPPKLNKYIKDHKPSTLTKQDGMSDSESETENCARINSVAKWPTVSKRIWKLKNRTQGLAAKKMRLKSEDTLIDLGTDDLCVHQTEENKDGGGNTDNSVVKKLPENNQECRINSTPINVPVSNNIVVTEHSKPKSSYIQFHSAHFDIRSSPIKASSSTVFRKFQINQNQLQVVRSLETVGKDKTKVSHTLQNPGNNLHIPISRSNENVCSNGNLHIPMSSSSGSLHIPMSSSNGNLHIPMSSSSDSLHIPMSSSGGNLHIPMSSSSDSLHIPMSSSSDSLHMPMSSSNGNLHIPMSSSSDSLHIPISNSTGNLHVTLPNDNFRIRLPNSSNGLTISSQSSDTSQPAKSANSDKINSSLSVLTLPNSLNGLHVNLPDSDNDLQLPLPNSESSLPLPSTENSLDISISLPNTENSLHDIFKDGVDLSCKDDSSIDPVLKDWIISTNDKSEDSLQSFTKSNGLTAFLHGTDSEDKSMDQNVTHRGDMPSLEVSDNRLLSSQGESVLNFLETLGNELVYPETEIRNSGVDFQLDLFAFHNT